MFVSRKLHTPSLVSSHVCGLCLTADDDMAQFRDSTGIQAKSEWRGVLFAVGLK
jgi:hypothetical protein